MGATGTIVRMGLSAGRHRAAVERLRRALLGATDPVEGPAAVFATKVRDDASRITDGDVDALLAAGLSEDRVLEVALAAALGAADVRLRAGLSALRGGDAAPGAD
ncbi:MAG: hypothetical protein QOD63_2996 [Actinomycetota bacterium]|nr:hypothetical protein [Actinomycetota bacterium]